MTPSSPLLDQLMNMPGQTPQGIFQLAQNLKQPTAAPAVPAQPGRINPVGAVMNLPLSLIARAVQGQNPLGAFAQAGRQALGLPGKKRVASKPGPLQGPLAPPGSVMTPEGVKVPDQEKPNPSGLDEEQLSMLSAYGLM